MNHLILAAASLALATSITVPAAAEIENGSATRIVIYADLDLTNATGLRTLDRRLHAAVRDVCGRADPRNLAVTMKVKVCQRTALADATHKRDLAVNEAATRKQLASNLTVTAAQ